MRLSSAWLRTSLRSIQLSPHITSSRALHSHKHRISSTSRISYSSFSTSASTNITSPSPATAFPTPSETSSNSPNVPEEDRNNNNLEFIILLQNQRQPGNRYDNSLNNSTKSQTNTTDRVENTHTNSTSTTPTMTASLQLQTSSKVHERKARAVMNFVAGSSKSLKVSEPKDIYAQTTLAGLSTGETSFINPILRAIAASLDGSSAKGASLLGESPTEKAEVESWMDWCETELEQRKGKALMALAKDALEKHLTHNTFLVGHQVTLADVCVCLSLQPHAEAGVLGDMKKSSPALSRWYNTIMFAKEMKEAVAAGSSAPATASSSASSTSSPAELMLRAEDRPLTAHYSSRVGGRTKIGRLHLATDQGRAEIGKKIHICGWVRSIRDMQGRMFIEINDGSSYQGMQAVVEPTCPGFDKIKGAVNTGASVGVRGVLVESPAKGQVVELLAKNSDDSITVYGAVDAAKYPLPNKPHSKEFLREQAHLRPRTHMIGCVTRVRNALAYATHEFFRRRGFLWIHTPCITASDCEGAGEMFQVTTLLSEAEKKSEEKKLQNVQLPNATIRVADPSGDPKKEKIEEVPCKADYSKDFFKKKAFLTVSGQLAVENYCCSLSDVYTFGPCFRAEDSHTARHLSEFWMIEPELAFADLPDVMDCAEDYLKFCVQYAMDNNRQDLEFFDARIEKGLIKRLENLLGKPFGRLTYTEAIDLLKKDIKPFTKYCETKHADLKKSMKKAEWDELFKIEWGIDLHSCHEKYICEEIYKRPTAVVNYPAAIKSFYMRANDDGKTCAAMDILAPGVGEVIGGSVREERYDVLNGKLKDNGLDEADYWWYMDLRKYGTVPHGGFGLGFERLIMLTTGMDNIRDVIPYPRAPGKAEF